jgi:hypothetical protein
MARAGVQVATDLSRLRVSLTKHGAHKIAQLIEAFNPDDVVASVWDVLPGIRIDAAKVRAILSAGEGNKVPQLWHSAKAYGVSTVQAATLLAIIFSHHRLIEVLRTCGTGFARGIIPRDAVEGVKEFTNLKDDIRSLGFSKYDAAEQVQYDFGQLFVNVNVPSIAAQLFEIKLRKAGWNRGTALLDECIAQGFHEALAISEDQFREWMTLGAQPLSVEQLRNELQRVVSNEDVYGDFEFQSGHKPRKTSSRRTAFVPKDASVDLAHNQLQTKLYKQLCNEFGEDNIGTEKSHIDIIRRSGSNLIFYELKVGQDIRSCIREALSQLLEYSYWPDKSRATRLVIVAPCSPTDAARKYLAFLRSRFGLPIYYQQINATSGVLSDEI